MTPQQILNADLGTIGRWARQGLSWWVQELTDLIPPALRRRPRQGTRWLAEMTTLDGPIRLWRHGALAETLVATATPGRSADLLAPRDMVLVRDLEFPRLSAADLHRLVDLNIDRFTPFAADQVYFDTTVIGPVADGAKQRVRLGVITRDRAKAILARADAMGLKVERFGIGGGEDGVTQQFDFMRAVWAEAGGDPTNRRRVWLWAACAGLVAANLLVAVLRDMNDVAQLQRLIDAQQPTVTLALRLRKTVEAERARRLALLTRRSVHEPLRILDAVTRDLPNGQWALRLEWNGRAVRLVGFKQPDFDMLTALHGPALGNARSLLSDMPTKTPNGLTPFDVMADAPGEATR
ncbi:MAG: hypothetical protein P4L64_14635 [Caulobacteraceae bacterium]|nr:hypothetical protein [Caulobacteraceae bacterium]